MAFTVFSILPTLIWFYHSYSYKSLFSFAAGTLLLVTVSWILYQVGKKNVLITLSNAVPVTITLLSWIPFLIYVPYGLIAIPIKLIS